MEGVHVSARVHVFVLDDHGETDADYGDRETVGERVKRLREELRLVPEETEGE
jgi:hypothetical protein